MLKNKIQTALYLKKIIIIENTASLNILNKK